METPSKVIVPVLVDMHPEQHNPTNKYGWTTHSLESYPVLNKLLLDNPEAKEELKKFMFNFTIRK